MRLAQGLTAVLLKYRVPKRGGEFLSHHHALQDLQRSVRIVRSRAADWGIDPNAIGVCGFSAGGHLCAMLSAHPEDDHYPKIDGMDKVSAKPNFAILIYPAFLTQPRASDHLDPLLAEPRRGVTPPLFLAAASDDSFTRGMLNFLLAMHAAKIPTECHMYASGGHGGGLETDSYPTSEWVSACSRWLRDLASPPAK